MDAPTVGGHLSAVIECAVDSGYGRDGEAAVWASGEGHAGVQSRQAWSTLPCVPLLLRRGHSFGVGGRGAGRESHCLPVCAAGTLVLARCVPAGAMAASVAR